ncbi:hypothetical protein [Burkholderia ubonensis]|uniref:hypothetical protein n=1 Tax=Burkholderia ubonensis TaxID=101571 RepID=UPI00076D0316|nr:hypothetical protein [Burkholderia ubonensis]KVD29912.1 hypothetical protein WI82_11410 [Burkholderia ubonensis]
MATFVREPIDGWLIRQNDEMGKRAAPGCLFRFGRVAMDGRSTAGGRRVIRCRHRCSAIFRAAVVAKNPDHQIPS